MDMELPAPELPPPAHSVWTTTWNSLLKYLRIRRDPSEDISKLMIPKYRPFRNDKETYPFLFEVPESALPVVNTAEYSVRNSGLSCWLGPRMNTAPKTVITIEGDFNRWRDGNFYRLRKMHDSNVYRCFLFLEPGIYYYAYRVNNIEHYDDSTDCREILHKRLNMLRVSQVTYERQRKPQLEARMWTRSREKQQKIRRFAQRQKDMRTSYVL